MLYNGGTTNPRILQSATHPSQAEKTKKKREPIHETKDISFFQFSSIILPGFHS